MRDVSQAVVQLENEQNGRLYITYENDTGIVHIISAL